MAWYEGLIYECTSCLFGSMLKTDGNKMNVLLEKNRSVLYACSLYQQTLLRWMRYYRWPRSLIRLSITINLLNMYLCGCLRFKMYRFKMFVSAQTDRETRHASEINVPKEKKNRKYSWWFICKCRHAENVCTSFFIFEFQLLLISAFNPILTNHFFDVSFRMTCSLLSSNKKTFVCI